jgi:hypothetical protein
MVSLAKSAAETVSFIYGRWISNERLRSIRGERGGAPAGKTLRRPCPRRRHRRSSLKLETEHHSTIKRYRDGVQSKAISPRAKTEPRTDQKKARGSGWRAVTAVIQAMPPRDDFDAPRRNRMKRKESRARFL